MNVFGIIVLALMIGTLLALNLLMGSCIDKCLALVYTLSSKSFRQMEHQMTLEDTVFIDCDYKQFSYKPWKKIRNSECLAESKISTRY